MIKRNVKLNHSYAAKVSGKVTLVSIDSVNPAGGWNATNVSTGRKIRIVTAGRLTEVNAPQKPAATVEKPVSTATPVGRMAQYRIERRKNSRAKWVATSHTVEATTANGALRKFGMRDAFVSTKIKVCKGGKTGREYRAVPATA